MATRALTWLSAQAIVASPIASETILGQVKELAPIVKLGLDELEILN